MGDVNQFILWSTVSKIYMASFHYAIEIYLSGFEHLAIQEEYFGEVRWQNVVRDNGL